MAELNTTLKDKKVVDIRALVTYMAQDRTLSGFEVDWVCSCF